MNNFFDSISEFDWNVLFRIHDVFSCKAMDYVMTFLTYFLIALVLAEPLLLFFRKKKLDCVFLIITSSAALLTAQFILKLIVMRERPYESLDPNIYYYLHASGSSFPSGHAALMFAAAAYGTKSGKKFIAPLYIAAVVTAFTRLYLFAHFPSDVIAGALIGTLIGVVTNIAARKTEKLLDEKKRRKSFPES